MKIVKEFIKETLKVFFALLALILLITSGVGTVYLIVIGLMSDWRLFLLGILALSAWIAFINITNKNIKGEA